MAVAWLLSLALQADLGTCGRALDRLLHADPAILLGAERRFRIRLPEGGIPFLLPFRFEKVPLR